MKKQFKYSIYASLLVSMSVLAYPTISKAATNDSDQQSVSTETVAENSSDESSSQTSSQTDVPAVSATQNTDIQDPKNQPSSTVVQNSNSNDAKQTTSSTQATTTNDQSQPSVVDVNGVFTVGSETTPLTDQTGTNPSNRSVAAGSAWFTDKLVTAESGETYYRVSTLEYINSKAGTFTSNVSDYSSTATITYKKGADVHAFTGYGDSASYTGTNLPTDSAWKIDKRANINGKYWYEVGNNLWVPQDYLVVSDAPDMLPAAWVSGVPLIAQRPELPNGCEITAVTMMLQYAGANVDKMQLAKEMPRNSDPNYGYIGQPWDSTGITIFPNALMSLVEKYAGTAKDLTGQNFDAIKYQIDIGHPVVTWNTLHGFPYHALTVTGYDSQYVYYNDCWTDVSTQMDINAFIQNWNTQNRRAISY
ncbi:C39 family peptidase [Companilactobacillus sp.]|uniref:C39 family peptidase n=1 Tax=Companilactobacillus sp. TaxID=2767905 RepID=UPI0025BE0B81|nr:C39 family peptidase [Companilactobacillus sp.]MCH4009057.1 C39 family peptidase [Companilactobacillus sp.]MCH4050764.1 C39 family peptidase [Companilactobacillus sp.]MCH4076999.1 C39 family peptidase [Companilactobacillus sp.]MCH4125575.1 C39 family peptidase [Companilactobacillus sp.]MCI1311284.1 C39 family peptidase [Companilactobacillus sp.]